MVESAHGPGKTRVVTVHFDAGKRRLPASGWVGWGLSRGMQDLCGRQAGRQATEHAAWSFQVQGGHRAAHGGRGRVCSCCVTGSARSRTRMTFQAAPRLSAARQREPTLRDRVAAPNGWAGLSLLHWGRGGARTSLMSLSSNAGQLGR